MRVQPDISRGYSTTRGINAVDEDEHIPKTEGTQQDVAEASATMDGGGEEVVEGEGIHGEDPTPEQLEEFMLKLRDDVESVLRVRMVPLREE